MEISLTAMRDSFLQHLGEKLDQAPIEPGAAGSWKELLLGEVRDSLEVLIEQTEHYQASSAELKRENDRLRTRLAGMRAVESAVGQRAEAFRSLAEHSPDGIIRLDAGLRVQYVNPAVEFFSGLPREDYIGRVFSDIFEYPQVREHRGLLETVRDQCVEERLEIQVNTRLGPHWFDLRIAPEVNNEGRVDSLLIVARDITALKEVESALSRSEKRLRVATSRAGFVVFEHDRDLVYTWVHSPDHIGRSSDVLGKRDDEIYPEETAQKLLQIKRRVLESGTGIRMDLMVPKDGELRCFDTIYEPISADDGSVTGLVCSVVDVTVRRRLEADVLRQREVLKKIFEANPSGMAVVSGPDFVIQMANAAYQAVTPHPEISPVGLAYNEVWKEEQGFSGSSKIRPVLDENASITLEHVTQRYLDGSLRSFTIHVRPLNWGDQPAALIAVWERTELDHALKESSRRAAEAEEGRRTLEALMEYIPEGIVIASSPDLRLLYVSEYFAGLAGMRRADMQGRLFSEFSQMGKIYSADGVTPLDMDQHPLWRAALNAEVVEGEEMVLVQDGSKVRLLCNAGPIRDKEETVLGSVLAMHDITDRERSESHQRFLTEMGRALVALLSPEEMVQGIATRIRRYLQVEYSFFCAGDAANGANIIPAVVSVDKVGAETISLENPFPPVLVNRLKRGRVTVIADAALDPSTRDSNKAIFGPLGLHSFIAIPMLDRAGRWEGTLVAASASPRVWRPDEVGLLGSVADLARLALENAHLFADLQDFRHRFEIALRNAPITVLTTDSNRVINWAFNLPHGFTSADLLGKRAEDLLSVEDSAPLIDITNEVLKSGETTRQEVQATIGGQRYQFNMTVEPLRDVEGNIYGTTVALLDITQQRLMEAEALLNMAHIEIQHRLIQERERERTRIARELHDGPLQDLIATNFTLVEAMDINEKKARLSKMYEIQATLQRQIRELRRFCNELRPPVLAPFGLEKTIRSHAESFQERFPGLRIELELERDERKLPEDLRMNLFRVYQELLTNVVRHAQAKLVTVRFDMEEQQAVLEVEDDGVGFQSPQSWVELARKGHLGLVGLQERVEMAGGRVDIDSGPGKGTRVRVIVPR